MQKAMLINLIFKVLREPLVQFLLLGSLIFIVDISLTVNKDDPQVIVIDENRLEKLIGIFKEGQGRLPNQQEIDNLIVKWTQNEIFYREALALNLDEGDEMMRSRLILKMRNILFNRVVEQAPTEEALQEWFALNREKYDTPQRYSFEQFPVDDVETLQQLEVIAEQVNNNGVPDDLQTLSRKYPRRPRANLDALFGVENTDALLKKELMQWMPVRSETSWHLARIYETSPPIPADFAQVKSKVIREYKKAASGLQVSEMAEAISDKYQVYLEFDNKEVVEILASAANTAINTKPITADVRSLKARAGVAENQSIQ